MSLRFDFLETPITDLWRIGRKPVEDQRGYLSRIFCEEEFNKIGFDRSVAQINHTLTRKKGSVRGMHFQYPPHAESKLVTCIKGEILDVAIDIRKDSATFLKWHAEVLSDNNHASLLIPEGFAHGFQTLVDDCELLYVHSKSYFPEAEGALNAFDQAFSIEWPLEVTEMSARDRSHPFLTELFEGIVV